MNSRFAGDAPTAIQRQEQRSRVHLNPVQRRPGAHTDEIMMCTRQEERARRRTDEKMLGPKWVRLPGLLELALIADLLLRRRGRVNAHCDAFTQRDEVCVAREKHEAACPNEPRLILFAREPAVYPHHRTPFLVLVVAAYRESREESVYALETLREQIKRGTQTILLQDPEKLLVLYDGTVDPQLAVHRRHN